MIYNGLEDLSEHPIDVVTVPGDHEGMLSVSQIVDNRLLQNSKYLSEQRIRIRDEEKSTRISSYTRTILIGSFFRAETSPNTRTNSFVLSSRICNHKLFIFVIYFVSDKQFYPFFIALYVQNNAPIKQFFLVMSSFLSLPILLLEVFITLWTIEVGERDVRLLQSPVTFLVFLIVLYRFCILISLVNQHLNGWIQFSMWVHTLFESVGVFSLSITSPLSRCANLPRFFTLPKFLSLYH